MEPVIKILQPNQTSFFADGLASTRYRQGKWTKAPFHLRVRGYHLFVFVGLEEAVAFVNSLRYHKDARYWSALADGVLPTVPPMRSSLSLAYNYFFLRPVASTNFKWPIGTLVAKRVMIQELIGDHKECQGRLENSIK